jgi:Arc/MetJ family transcription regulator
MIPCSAKFEVDMQAKVLRWLSTGVLHRVVQKTLTGVSDELTASTIRLHGTTTQKTTTFTLVSLTTPYLTW